MCFDATVIFVFVHCQSVCVFLLASDFQFSVTVSSSSLPVSAFCLWCFYSWVDVVPYLLHASMIRVPFFKILIGGTFSHCSVTCRLKKCASYYWSTFCLDFFLPEDLGEFFWGVGGGVPPQILGFRSFQKPDFEGPARTVVVVSVSTGMLLTLHLKKDGLASASHHILRHTVVAPRVVQADAGDGQWASVHGQPVPTLYHPAVPHPLIQGFWLAGGDAAQRDVSSHDGWHCVAALGEGGCGCSQDKNGKNKSQLAIYVICLKSYKQQNTLGRLGGNFEMFTSKQGYNV